MGTSVWRAGIALAAIAGATVLPMGAATAEDGELGAWSEPFAEPTINGEETDEFCVEGFKGEAEGQEPEHGGRNIKCKPTATSLAVLGAQDVVYWNGLEDTEEVENSIVAEFGEVTTQDQVRRLDLASRTWTPSEADPDGPRGDEPLETIPGAGLASTETYNDDILFCAALTHTASGHVMTVGGTTYYQEPDLPDRYGVVELQGSKATRFYDPASNSWERGNDMNWGRWYPTLVPLADGRQFVAGGVSKLMKPVYSDRDPEDSGRNVPQTEIYDSATGEWTDNGESGEKSLPLYPRLHLVPGGGVYFNAAGQVYNPQGQAYDQALWNFGSVYDPEANAWTDVGVPNMTSPFGGFRGSTTSTMLPLAIDPATGDTTQASFLTAGGILGTTPGTYFAVTDSRVDTLDTEAMSLSSETVGALNTPRWYGQAVLLPTGEVFMVNGASADEVVGPGTAMPVLTPELWDPETGEWTQLEPQSEARTYHNSAALLPDGSVLVGGHDPISTLYASNITLLEGTTTPNETRNPTFEIFSPPYLFRGEQPEVLGGPTTISPDGGTATFAIDTKGSELESVVLMRDAAVTHLVDGGQRAVELPVVMQNGVSVTVRLPADSSIAPAGPYHLFANRSTDDGPVPSEGYAVTVTQGDAAVTAVTPLSGESEAAHGADVAPATDAATTALQRDFGDVAAVAAAQPDAGSTVVTDSRMVRVDADLAYHEGAELHAAAARAIGEAAPETGLFGSLELTRADGSPREGAVLVVVALVAIAADAVRRRARAMEAAR